METLLLRGAIDTHVHSGPDVVRRRHDDLALVEQARAAGMRGLVLKSHVFSTCERAYLLNCLYPDFRVFGGLALNDTIGGLNPRAVEAALKLGAACVWMPTKSAANHRRQSGETGGLTVIAAGDSLTEDVLAILRLVADAGAVLATGHIAPAESLVLIEKALALGVRRVSVTHPEWGLTAVPVATQRELAATGRVYFERCLVSAQTDLRGHVPFAVIVDQIRAVGTESTVIATDFGMPQYPAPVDGMRTYIAALLRAGFTETEVARMCRDNPADLLGWSTA